MKKNLYIIPGWDSKCDDKPYQKLATSARAKGYEVICRDIDWQKPFSKQVFEVGRDDVVFGFSLGAILAWLVAQKSPCKHLILASMTLHKSFKDEEDIKALNELVGKELVDDIIQNLKSTNLAEKQTSIYGELENEKGDILVSNTEHELNDDYIEEILRLL